MTVTSRLRMAARALVRGNIRSRRQTPVRSITPEEAAEFRRFFARPKFFVFGHARSGTTLLMRLLRLHPEVHCDYQAHFFTRRPLLTSLVDTPEVEEWLSRKSNRWNHGKDLSPIVLRAAAEYIMERDAAKLGKRIVGDKSPSSTIHGQSVRDLFSLFPDARLLYIVRDGRDVLVSERFRNFVEESRFLVPADRRILQELRRAPAEFGKANRSIFTAEALQRIASGWARNVQEINAEGRRLFKRQYVALRYEDLIADPIGELRGVWKFLGAREPARGMGKRVDTEMHANPDQEWQSRRNQEIASFLPKGKAGNWRALLTEEDKALFKQVAGQRLIEWGYERSDDW